ncbi:hypothetical protein [Qipengyuania citrea]|uniref:hypothetical protein n=1 Tax=Qipengyuania citrea TaxID=225971 RepID=UPI003297B413
MPLWLDLLRTPMAAPETPRLKRMRMTILSICGILLVSIAALAPLRAAIGIAAGGIVAALLAILAVLVPIYVVTKNRADDRYLDSLGEDAES